MRDVLQLVGALLILAAFVAAQRGLSPHAVSYLALNVVGSAILTVVAAEGRDWGFLLLEVVWTAVSAWSLVEVLRGRTPAGAR